MVCLGFVLLWTCLLGLRAVEQLCEWISLEDVCWRSWRGHRWSMWETGFS